MPANRRSNEYCQYLNWIKIERLATYTSRTWFPSSKNPWWQVPLKRGAAIGLVTITPPTGVTGRAQECSGRNVGMGHWGVRTSTLCWATTPQYHRHTTGTVCNFDQMKPCGYAPRSKVRTMHMAAPTASASMPSSHAITRLVWTACARPQRALPACVPAGSSATRIRGIAIGRRPSRETPAVGAGSSRETNALRATGSSVTSRTLSKKAWLWAGLTISGSKMPERTYGRTRVHIPVV